MSSLLWQIPLAIALLGFAWFFISLAFQLGKTLKSIESVVDGQVVPLLRELNQTTSDLNRDFPQLPECHRLYRCPRSHLPQNYITYFSTLLNAQNQP